MSLIKSISGIRGTIGGQTGDNLTPLDIVKFASAFGTWLQQKNNKKDITLVVGRDARISGKIVSDLASATLQSLGINVIDLGLSTTPTVEVMVPELNADGGIIFTASHNPKEWNALKLLNDKGEFINAQDGADVLELADKEAFDYIDVDHLGSYSENKDGIQIHVDKVLELPEVFPGIVREKRYKIVVDAVNSTGGIAIPKLLERMGCDVVKLYCEPNGQFPHNPEPLKEHLSEICELVVKEKADLGIVVDPDVDRLALVDENGDLFGEEYTLVAVADYILRNKKGVAISNLSSSRALRDVAKSLDSEYFASAVGEVNVVNLMKEKNAVIGGEGNGGIIFPDLHYGRDSLVGVALFLSHLAQQDKSVSELRATYPDYYMGKKKIELTPEINVDKLLEKVKKEFKNEEISTVDGVKIDFPTNWVHLRKSNTEPIIRIYTEASTQEEADQLADDMIAKIKSLI
ncbi:phosphoglucosamine mutase [Elizabethkingia meningoseptica]|uniref:phosphoglucosamine mutase n=1 Tax=Elizabethkingia meningoseptica TaxID=238 RepID=UPI00099A7EF3|nr:phosphoglucosamine mutase [Elizabethkingia meningoseptica]MCL1675921.1 phosphoglucosamine mutase [Elizabethkingia meningoseptica]MCL1686433.1 phosphoglucosamine mutase [Elizabethkingia meningoseptica]MDE5431841.1 phosphoglucosamine mutase [Elizabethkingia meningoseptica]MDE5437994.1 phosphoglucosamine mutase [Elizabethkingia meningoseptica]MDE5492154.1 phosphoglucosamine mutase [Elizabethkingia meningoseptica]